MEVVFYLDKERYEKQKRILKNQFQDLILSIATNLKVGYSPENAFLEAYTDLLLLYGTNSRIIYELETIKKGLAVNLTLDKLLAEFDKNCQIEEISEFVDIFCLANRTGGNLVEVIETSGDIISGKIATDEEIEVILSAGKMECHIMMGIPFLIIMYIGLTNKGFFTPLYHNVAGIIIMSICLMVYLAAVRISGRIISIRI